jgi:voltage-gated potassium channel
LKIRTDAASGGYNRADDEKEMKTVYANHWVAAWVFTVLLIGLIAVATFDPARWTFAVAMPAMVGLTAISFNKLFPGSRFFVFALANALGIYATIFQYFLVTNFSEVESPALETGFAMPILAFLAGAWRQRRRIRAIVTAEEVDDERGVLATLIWLAPVLVVGILTFVLPGLSLQPLAANVVFFVAMAAIAAVVFSVSPMVSAFLIDSGHLFEEFFLRVRGVAVAAFTFVTFYSVLVILFASIYRILDLISYSPNFKFAGTPHHISFPEALYFSIVTLATVGYGDVTPLSDVARVFASIQVVLGVLLLLFGFSEIMAYTKSRRGRS